MKYVLFYETADNAMPLARLHFPAHKVRADEFHARGALLLVGTWANPQEGSMGIFTTKEEAEAFVRDDPFVLHKVVKRWEIKEWNETLG